MWVTTGYTSPRSRGQVSVLQKSWITNTSPHFNLFHPSSSVLSTLILLWSHFQLCTRFLSRELLWAVWPPPFPLPTAPSGPLHCPPTFPQTYQLLFHFFPNSLFSFFHQQILSLFSAPKSFSLTLSCHLDRSLSSQIISIGTLGKRLLFSPEPQLLYA